MLLHINLVGLGKVIFIEVILKRQCKSKICVGLNFRPYVDLEWLLRKFVNVAVSLQCYRVSGAVGCCRSAPFWYKCATSSY